MIRKRDLQLQKANKRFTQSVSSRLSALKAKLKKAGFDV